MYFFNSVNVKFFKYKNERKKFDKIKKNKIITYLKKLNNILYLKIMRYL